MPNRSSAVIAGAPETVDCSSAEPSGAPDEPDQRSRGFFERIFDRIVPRTALVRFLGYVRPHLWLVAGGSVMGILKFTLPLAFPLAFKYVFDVLLVPQPQLEASERDNRSMVHRDRRDAASRRRLCGQARSSDGRDVRAVRGAGDRDLLPQLLGEHGRAIG